MHVSKKIGVLSLTAYFALGLTQGALAAQIADPEGAVPPQVSTPAPDISNDVEISTDVEESVSNISVMSSPPVKKLSVTTNQITLDGKMVKPAGYNINDENYFKLRDIAFLMNGKKATFGVDYDSKTNSVLLTTGEAYQPDGLEMKTVSQKPKIQTSAASVMLDGKAISMTAYNIDGNNYFRLRDIGNYLGFEVDFINNIVTLSSGRAVAYTVAFDMNGLGTQIPSTTVEELTRVSEPALPVADGFVFGGWYIDAACTTAWNFAADTVAEDLTLYAKWNESFTVTFESNGHGSSVDPLYNIADGSKITAPIAPTDASFVFNGWYMESECQNAWNFGIDTVTSDTTLYAKWSRTYTVRFDMNGQGTQIDAQTGIVDGSLVKQPPNPTATGYTFGGWYIDQGCTIQWVFGMDRVVIDTTLYAMWTDINGNHTDDVITDDTEDTDDTTDDSNNTQTPRPPATSNNTTAIDGKITILLDPGHGGTDAGASGNGMNENELNLSVALPLRDMLTNAGANVIMTREDVATTLRGTNRRDRVLDICSQGNIDFVISIHHNSYNGSASGAEVFVQTASKDAERRSKELGQLLIEEYKKLGQSSRGVKDSSSLYMVYSPGTYGVPSLLSEFCFLDNAADAARINSQEEREAEARAIYNAIIKYFESHPY